MTVDWLKRCQSPVVVVVDERFQLKRKSRAEVEQMESKCSISFTSDHSLLVELTETGSVVSTIGADSTGFDEVVRF